MISRNIFKSLFINLASRARNSMFLKSISQNKWKQLTFLSFSTLGFAFINSQYRFKLDEFYEQTINDDLQEGEKRAVQVGPKDEDTVLVVKYQGQYYCLSNACPHFGFSLSKGFLIDDKITCPLHMAQFSIKTGYHDFGPVFQGLEQFEITQQEGKLHIKVPKSKLNVPKTIPMSKKGNDKRRFVIVGGGVAALSAAETLRQTGFEGEITILTKEKYLPYNKTLLSKIPFFIDSKKIQLRDDEFFKKYDIDVVLESEVTKIDYQKQFVESKNGKHWHYEKLLLATGGTPRVPDGTSGALSKVHVLRTWDDLQAIRDNAKVAKNIVVIGSSFIGLETAASLKSFLKDKINVTVCDMVSTPFERILGKEVGESIQSLHEQNGIKFQMNSSLSKIENNPDGSVKGVVLSNGKKLPADMVLLATGIFFTPATKFVGNIKKTGDGSIETDLFLKTSQQDVYAAGDVASYPYWYTGERVRIEHYNEAIYQGYVAALNMMGRLTPMSTVPFFWTRFWDKSLQYSGHPTQWDDYHIDGDIKAQNFIIYYFWNGNVVGAAGMNKIPHITMINEAMKLNVMPKAHDLKAGRVTIEEITKRVQSQSRKCACRRAQETGLNNNPQ